MAKIIYTHTDEAPMLATYSFLPIVSAYARTAGVEVETRDISLAGRIIAQFPDRLTDEQRLDDALAELGELATKPEANIIKLPNISASIPQLKAAVKELQDKGYDLPDYPENPQTDEERDARARYDKVKGSAVNPVLREGNSDRRAPASVKNYAKAHPHSMGAWSSDSRTNVATMGADDFRSNEKSVVLDADGHPLASCTSPPTAPRRSSRRRSRSWPARSSTPPSCSVAALRRFLTEQVARAKAEDVLFSVHLKATMMKVSDPIIFGHVVQAFFPDPLRAVRRAAGRRGHQPQRRPRRPAGRHRQAPRGRGHQEGRRAGHRRGSRPGDGRLRQGHHQPARAVRRHRRRLDAGHDPHLGPHVERRRRRAGHPRGDPRLVVRLDLPDRHRRLPRPRRLRPLDHGLGAQRRPDGQGGRGVRLPRQDLRDPGGRPGRGPQRRRRRADRARRRAGRHLARLPDQGRPDPRLGQAGRHPRPRHRRPGDLLARRGPRPRRQPDRQGQGVPPRARHRGADHRDHDARPTRRPTASSGSARARTPSR